jgi:acyl-CoA synthetase (NDP forming)
MSHAAGSDASFEEIRGIIHARSLAIVGASDKPGKFGTLLTASQLAMGFDGPVYLVNPGGGEILGRKVYPDLGSLPEAPELVSIAVPAHRSMPILRECAGLGVKGVVMVASGFREAGEDGRRLEQEAIRTARRGGFRIIGPNCFGIYNPRTRLTLTPGHDFSTVSGDIAFISQSGGYSAHVARLGKSLDLSFRAVISYGNGSDLDERHFLRYFGQDNGTGIVAGYLEGTRDGRGFLEALTDAAERKPVVLWKVGRGEASQRVVSSHTGSMAGAHPIWNAALSRRGVIQVSGVDELGDVLVALKHLGPDPGRRVMFVGGGGGLGAFAADLVEEEGLELPPLKGSTGDALREILKGAGAVVGNPLDIGTPIIPFPLFEAVLREAAAHASADVLLLDLAVNFAMLLGGTEGMVRVAEILARVRSESGRAMAVVLYSRACDPDDLEPERAIRRMRSILLKGSVAVFPSMPRAMRALSLVNR